MSMSRGSLRFAINWIAFNDNAGNGDSVEEVAEYITTSLVADMFNKDVADIAARVMKVREGQQ